MVRNFTALHIEDQKGKKLHTALIGLSLGLIIALGVLVWYLIVQQQQREMVVKPVPKKQQTTEQIPGDNESQASIASDSAQPTASPSGTLTPTSVPSPTTSPTATPSGIMNQ